MNKKGFTLIELLAVFFIIGIIVIIVLPQLVEERNKKTYKEAICYFGGEIKEFKIDKIIYDFDSEIKIESNGKTYELQKNNCYLIGKEE